MKLSKYVIMIKENTDSYLIASTLSRAIIRLNPLAKKDLENGNQNSLRELTREQFQECIDMNFLVPDDLDEKKFVNYLLHKDRLCPQALTTYVAFSTICNFRCVYCYEDGQITHQTMSEQMIDLLISWYKTKLEEGHFEICLVDLYGGEPLLFMPLIVKLLSKLKEITSVLGIKLKVRLVTNGYLLTVEIVQQLLKFGLDTIHVTLDGPAPVHNQRRPLKNGKGTFNVVFNNILDVARSFLPVEIICRISFDRTNVSSIPALLDLIKEKDNTGTIDPYFGSVTQTISQIIIPESFCSLHVLEDRETAENIIFLYSEAKKRGFTIPDFFSLGPCMVVADGAGIIAPDGSIYKCLDMMGCKKFIVDNISSEKPRPCYYDFMVAPQLEHCLSTDCPFVPVCGGGCIMEAFLKTGDHNKLICHRQMIEKIYHGLLPLQFLN